MPIFFRPVVAACLAFSVLHALAAPKDFRAANDAQVIETLSPRAVAATTPQAAAQAATQWISLARQSADPRYLGRAQASLGPWWDRADAPTALAVLQATVQQSRHEFDAARRTLERALQRDPAHAQGWLTLATLERVAGRFDAAQTACAHVARLGAALHAQACVLESASLKGQHDRARSGLQALAHGAGDAPTRAWALSLLAESEERAGRDDSALTAYQQSLALQPDGYTALALADLHLRRAQPQAALQTLSQQPAGDAVLLRRAYAHQQLGNAQWRTLAAELRERFAALDARGDDPRMHARERALAHLWLDKDPHKALSAALSNLELQKEPLDWRVALESAQMAARVDEVKNLTSALARSGLQDARLARWLTRSLA